MNCSRGAGTAARTLGLAAVALAAAAAPVRAQSAEKVMERMIELGVDFVGVATNIPDRQNLGRREAPSGTVVYAWDVARTPDDQVAREHLLSVDHLRNAGIPAVGGRAPEFEDGMFGPQRFRLGGILTGIDIRGEARYEVRVNLDWQLYDTEVAAVIWEGSSRAMARGAVLGDRGEQPNVLMNAVVDALDSVLDDEVPGAIDEARG